MKQQKGILAFFLGMLLVPIQLSAQSAAPSDPLLNFKGFTEIGFVANGTRINSNHSTFKTKAGNFNFEKNTYLMSLDAYLTFGKLIKEKDGKTIRSIKTGINVINRKANLFDSAGTKWRHSTTFLQVPVQFGFRIPQRFNTVKNNLYRAFEFNIGFYLSIPMFEKLDHPDNVDSPGDFIPFGYIRPGFISELVYTALDSKGHGHKFGIRTNTELAHISEYKGTPSQLYPIYSTIGLFYNIANYYR